MSTSRFWSCATRIFLEYMYAGNRVSVPDLVLSRGPPHLCPTLAHEDIRYRGYCAIPSRTDHHTSICTAWYMWRRAGVSRWLPTRRMNRTYLDEIRTTGRLSMAHSSSFCYKGIRCLLRCRGIEEARPSSGPHVPTCVQVVMPVSTIPGRIALLRECHRRNDHLPSTTKSLPSRSPLMPTKDRILT